MLWPFKYAEALNNEIFAEMSESEVQQVRDLLFSDKQKHRRVSYMALILGALPSFALRGRSPPDQRNAPLVLLQDGVKRLELLLDSPDFKAKLDGRTDRIWPEVPVPREQRAAASCCVRPAAAVRPS